MSNSAKTLLIIAAALVVIGLAVMGIAYRSTGCDIKNIGTANYVTKTFDPGEDFDNITITADTEGIMLLPAEDGKCRVEFYGDEKTEVSASVSGDILNITAKNNRKWYENITIASFKSPKITVYLPKAEYVALTVNTDTGSVTVPESFSFADVGVKLDTGSVEIKASVTNELRVESDTGSVSLENMTAGSIDVKTDTGGIKMSSVACDGSISAVVSTGKTMLENVTCASLVSRGDTGGITMENVIASGSMTIERDTGGVRFQSCDAGEIEITTDTGSVTGSLLTEKVFITKSDTGKVEVPETTSGGKCKITTDTGNIRITIG